MSRPTRQLLVSDGTKLWSYDPELNQVAVKKLGAAFGASPAALFAGQDLDKHFELKEGGAPQTAWTTSMLRPTGSDTSFERVRIGFSANRPVSMDIHDSFGQVTHLRFTQIEANPNFAGDPVPILPPRPEPMLSASDLFATAPAHAPLSTK
jgi:outer membrane lipoprotein carrier protein